MEEIWKEISGYEGIYEISNRGRVRRIKGGVRTRAGLILKPGVYTSGYFFVRLYKSGIGKSFSVARLTGIAFLDNPNNLPQINHKDGVKLHNWVGNIEWCTAAYNAQHALKNGLMHPAKGEKHGRSKLTSSKVFEIKRLLKAGVLLQREIGALFGVSSKTISKIKLGRGWSHLSALGEF